MSKYSIGDNLRKIRMESGKKQLEIARLLGIEESAYSKIERGKVSINADKLIILSNLYNRPVSDFFEGYDFIITLPSGYSLHSMEHLHLIKKLFDEQHAILKQLMEKKNSGSK